MNTVPPKLELAVAMADNLNGQRNTRAINAAFRANDPEHADKAIRNVRSSFAMSGDRCEGLAYALAVNDEISRLVNQ